MQTVYRVTGYVQLNHLKIDELVAVDQQAGATGAVNKVQGYWDKKTHQTGPVILEDATLIGDLMEESK